MEMENEVLATREYLMLHDVSFCLKSLARENPGQMYHGSNGSALKQGIR